MFKFFSELYPTAKYKKLRREDGILIISNENLELVYLNETAAEFFIHCDGKTRVVDIFKIMLEEFDVDEITLKNDLCFLIRDMQWKNIISISYKDDKEK